MAVNLSPLAGAGAQFFDSNGVILSGGKLHTYDAGTTTPRTTFTNSTGGTPHANPIVLDSAGRVPGGEIWLTAGAAYKFALYTSLDVLIATYDNISGVNDLTNVTPTVYAGSGNGAAVAFTLPSAPLTKNTTSVYVNGVYQQKSTYSLSGVTLTFSEAPPLNSSVEVSYF